MAVKWQEFDFLEKIQDIARKEIEENNIEIENSDISQTEIELAKKLDAVQEFSVDRFEDDIVVLENRENGNRINVTQNKLPNDIKEGDILKCINGKYTLDKTKTLDESNRIQNKMDNLWNWWNCLTNAVNLRCNILFFYTLSWQH